MIHFLSSPATQHQFHDMLEVYTDMIKVAVDIRKGILAGGGEMHADCEKVLIDYGSEQSDIWGANWYPNEKKVAYEALINIRPRDGNPRMVIQDEEIRSKVREIVLTLMGAN
jgi:hypothetical protein